MREEMLWKWLCSFQPCWEWFYLQTSFQELLTERGGQDLIFHLQGLWQISRKALNPGVTTGLPWHSNKWNCFEALTLELAVSLEQQNWWEWTLSLQTTNFGHFCSGVEHKHWGWGLFLEHHWIIWLRTKIICQFSDFIAGASGWIKWCRGNTVKDEDKEKWEWCGWIWWGIYVILDNTKFFIMFIFFLIEAGFPTSVVPTT